MKISELAPSMQMDYTATVNRFMGKEEFLLKYLKRFPADKSYTKLCHAMNTGNTKDATFYSHSLKGLAGNLGLEDLYSSAKAMNDAGKMQDFQDFPALFARIKTDYEKVITALKQLD